MSKKSSINVISPAALHRLHKSGGVEVIDVRTPAEFREVHAAVVSANLPLDSLNPREVMRTRNGAGDKPLYVICRSGNRSRTACEKFVAAGYDNVVNVEGGTIAWEAAGFPVERGKKAVSLERQVRIAAGLLVVVGALLGWFVHPGFVFLSAFIGAGLAHSGITDTCVMTPLLARMPWNQVRDASCSP